MVTWKEGDRKKTMKTQETREMKGSIASTGMCMDKNRHYSGETRLTLEVLEI